MKSHTEESQVWNRVPPGTLAGIARRRKRTDRQRKIAMGTGLGLLLVGLGVGLFVVPASPRMKEYSFGGITCHQVMEAMPAYLNGTLPAERARRVAIHLRLCPHCSRMKPSRMPPAVFTPFGDASEFRSDQAALVEVVLRPYPRTAGDLAGTKGAQTLQEFLGIPKAGQTL